MEDINYKNGFNKKKAVENSEKSATIKSTNTKVINGTMVTNPMDRQKYLTMKPALERNGVKVIAAEGDDLAFSRSFGAEATYDYGYILHMGETPSASALFEEIIHWTQARKYGELEDTNPIELYAREIAANRMLLKNGHSYGFDEYDFADIRLNLPRWEERFKNAVGVSYDESEYNREI